MRRALLAVVASAPFLAGGLLLAGGGLGGAAEAARAAVDPNLLATCNSCHAVPGMTAGDPAVPVPRLLGQHPEYLARALRQYQSGERVSEIMKPMAEMVSDEQIMALSEVLGGERVRPPPGGTSHSSAPQVVLSTCGGCHGETGLGAIPEYPVIGGQHAEYLHVVLEEYRRGVRKNPEMQAFARQLTPAELAEVSAYYSEHTALRDKEPSDAQ